MNGLDTNVIQLASGRYHSAVLTEGGGIFEWGRGIHFNPKLVTLPNESETEQISCGGSSSLALTPDQKVYQWSSPDAIHKVSELDDKNVIRLSCSLYECSALTETGDGILWNVFLT